MRIPLLILLAMPLYSLAGPVPAGTTTQEEATSSTTASFFMHQKNYIPGKALNTSVKTIYLAINIWLKDDGSGNFSENDYIKEQVNFMMQVLNGIFINTGDPSRPIPGVEYLKDSNIRFELKDLSWYRNSAMHGADCSSGNKLNKAVFDKDPQKQQYLNIHLTSGNCIGAAGFAMFPSGRNMLTDGYIVSFIKYNPEEERNYPFLALALHIAHEIGHNLELRHPYDSEYCKFDHPDFLFDLFGNEPQSWCHNIRSSCDICYHQGGWTCNPHSPNTTCTNNLMGGNREGGSITPLQMGRMNRALTLKSVRKYAWGYHETPLVVSNDQRWEFNIKLYQDLVVQSGTTLELMGVIEMVPEAKIVVEPGARLVVDAGKIVTATYSDKPYQGVKTLKAPRKWYSFLMSSSPPGEVVVVNEGMIEGLED